MFKKIVVAVAFAAAALAQSQFSVNTPPSVIQCQPASISWVGGTGPFILAVIPGGQTGAAAIATLSSSLTSSPYTWIVNLPASTYLTLKLTDSTGAIAYSSPLTIQAGSSDACLSSTASTSGLSTGAVTTTGSGSETLSGSSVSGTTTSTTSAMSMSASSSMSTSTTSSASTPVASSPASSAASATSSGAAFPTALAGLPAVAAGVFGGLAVLL